MSTTFGGEAKPNPKEVGRGTSSTSSILLGTKEQSINNVPISRDSAPYVINLGGDFIEDFHRDRGTRSWPLTRDQTRCHWKILRYYY